MALQVTEHFREDLMTAKKKIEKWKKLTVASHLYKGLCSSRVTSYTYGWFMLRFDRKQQNSMKQLSFNKK